jgi:hypothetical protein
MKKRKNTAAKLRTWRVSILRQRAQYIGTVKAPGVRSAEAAAVAQFGLDEEQRRRAAGGATVICARSQDTRWR